MIRVQGIAVNMGQPKPDASEFVPSRRMLNRSFRIAYILHPHTTTAVRIVAEFSAKRSVMLKQQKRRGSAPPDASKSAASQLYLLSISECWERDQEGQPSKIRNNVYRPTADDLLVRYVNFLVNGALKSGSPSAILGLGSYLYRHPFPAMIQMISDILPPDIASSRNINKLRKGLVEGVAGRFPTLGAPISWQSPSPAQVELIKLTLEGLIPWGTSCRKSGTPIFELMGDAGAASEPNRVHALIDSGCTGFESVIRLYNLNYETSMAATGNVLRVPVFPGVRDSDGDATPKSRPEDNHPNATGEAGGSDRFNPRPLTDEEVNLIQDACSRYQERRRQYRTSPLRLFIDGDELLEFDPRKESCRPVRAQTGSLFLEIYGEDAEGACHLATVPLYDLTDGDSLQLKLASGQRLRLTVTGDVATDQLHLHIRYKDNLNLSLRELSRNLARWWKRLVRVPYMRWAPAGSAVLVLMAVLGSFWFGSPTINRSVDTKGAEEPQQKPVRFILRLERETTAAQKSALVARIAGVNVEEYVKEGVRIVELDTWAAEDDVIKILEEERRLIQGYDREELP